MRRNLEDRLARAEIAATAVRWADRQASHHRESLRTGLRFSGLIRELALGIDPALAVSLQRDEEAAAELAAIPDTDALRAADEAIVRAMREAHDVAARHKDVATTSLLEVFIDETEKRTWFLFEATWLTNQQIG